jgi:3-oxoacyl-[acyl-carrier-protein] synthase-1
LPEVFVLADHIVSPLGDGTAENFRQLSAGVSGIERREAGNISSKAFYASLFREDFLAFGQSRAREAAPSFTRFEQLLLAAISGALQKSSALPGVGVDPSDPDTILIISTTKGNIQLLETAPYSAALAERISLHTSARLIAQHLGFTTTPLVVSNACISGLLAIIVGTRLLRAGKYKHAVIAGADIVSRFILSGFESFQAVSPEPCKPFDAGRAGISLGEGAGAMVLSTSPATGAVGVQHPGRLATIRVLGGASGNDANHISGPSRTGRELAHVITRAMAESGLIAGSGLTAAASLGTGALPVCSPIDFISAHGTATPYNDEMEAKAITLAGLGSVPVHSLKGYYGHTFGAAGMIESIISIQSMREDCLIPSKGFEQLGVSEPINVIQSLRRTPLHHCLKTASGFGGCNAAVVFSKSPTL